MKQSLKTRARFETLYRSLWVTVTTMRLTRKILVRRPPSELDQNNLEAIIKNSIAAETTLEKQARNTIWTRRQRQRFARLYLKNNENIVALQRHQKLGI